MDKSTTVERCWETIWGSQSKLIRRVILTEPGVEGNLVLHFLFGGSEGSSHKYGGWQPVT